MKHQFVVSQYLCKMWFKILLIYVWLFRYVSCEKSLAIVLDTTGSMQEELENIKVGIISAISPPTNAAITDYILVPLNDSDVGTPTIVHKPGELISSVRSVTGGGGTICPENTLSAIEKALIISKPRSNIFVFTDAYARDAHKFGSVENLCRSTGSQVVIVLSGFCSSKLSPNATVQAYYDVARVCSGALLLFDAAALRYSFIYIREVINEEWTDITAYDTFTSYKQLSFSVDTYTTSLLIVVSGDYPKLEILTRDSSNHTVENVVDTRHTKVLRLKNPTFGNYTVKISCRDQTSLLIYKKYELPVTFGFSTKVPRKMIETSRRPMPGRVNYILVDASQGKLKLEGIEIQVANEEKKSLEIQETLTKGIYLTNTFIDPDKSFRIWIKGSDTTTFQEIETSSENIFPQKGTATDPTWTKPHSILLETDPVTVDFGTNATFACKVTGYPTPNIVWEDSDGNILPSEKELLEIPSLHISYVSLENATVNTTIYCKAKNSKGEDSQSINVYVHRPFTFEVIQTPEDKTIEYGSDGKLYCEVSAYPPAEVKWSYNNSAILPFDDVQIDPETNALWIKNMTTKNVGEYECEVTNEANKRTFSATVSISGIEAPEVVVDRENVTLRLGETTYLECRIIKGKPIPTITWQYLPYDGYDYWNAPEGTEVTDDGKLKIISAANVHSGKYKCAANNILGTGDSVILVQIQYPPSISDPETTTLTVKEEDDVVLPCKVKASPEATVHWEIPHEVILDSRHYTDQKHNHRFRALWKDSGDYECIAENGVGVARKTITVDVLVAPYIEGPSHKTVVARIGDNLVLNCNVQYGNPVPSTKWQFIAPDSTIKVLSRNRLSSPLHLNNVKYTNEGSYMCIADNSIGTDSITIYVKVL
ncbi:hemicentin-1-like [Helicoverpa zea]|uniref:hemicentin-1-like n=1 Tax=Helicoverpa zea TaxID=7113 RepID=UPI001F5AC001|nr:hemicentin-1-like [Helicoverpa zea]